MVSHVAAMSRVEYPRMPDAFDDSLFDNLSPSLEPRLVEALTVRKDFLFKHGFIKKDFSVHDWIDPAPLVAAWKLLSK